LLEILSTSSDEECMKMKKQKESKERNVQIEEEIDDVTEASALYREEESDREEVTAASCSTHQTS
jgi:hypothetical protein